MKKYLSFVFYFFCLSIIILNFSSSAFAYEKYLNGNKNFILVDGHMGYGFYLVKDSIKISSQSNKYELFVSAKIVVADERTKEIKDSYDKDYRYDLLANKMYSMNKYLSYEYVPKTGSWAETGVVLPAGNLIFQILKGRKFYNTDY